MIRQTVERALMVLVIGLFMAYGLFALSLLAHRIIQGPVKVIVQDCEVRR